MGQPPPVEWAVVNADLFTPPPWLARLLVVGVFLGAASIFAAMVCLLREPLRLWGVVAGAAGTGGGAIAACAYTLFYFFRGIDIEAVPSGPTAEWFVTGFGAAASLLAGILAASPHLRRHLKRSWPPGGTGLRAVGGRGGR